MRVGILSDTHDERSRTRFAIGLLRDMGADVLIHCGDLSSPPIVVECAVLPCWFVFGNHDADMVPELQKKAAKVGVSCLGWGGIIDLDSTRIGVVHGHLSMDVKRVLSKEPEYLLSGHSHIPSDTTVRSVRRINPGALAKADEYTVAMLDLESGMLQSFSIPE